ncbi:MAG TPA: 30S ribosomal protein S2, partial [Myxococcales bacterium]|nr:30S ribosomal protein S2 [Myxococcales bacterium]
NFLSRVVADGKQVLFVGTKRQAQEVIEEEANRGKQPYVTHRWLGGMLTNFQTVRQSLDRLNEIEKHLAEDNVERLSKKEILSFEKERNKLLRNLGGVRDMTGIPGAVFIVDPSRERIAVREALRLKIPIIGLCDTNCDPDDIQYPIPGNDDAIRAIKLFASAIADVCLSAKSTPRDVVSGFEKTFSSDDEGAQPATSETNVEVVHRGQLPEEETAKASDEAAVEAAPVAVEAVEAAEAPAEAAEAPAEAAEAPAEAAEAPAEAAATEAQEAPAEAATAETETNEETSNDA